MACQAIEVNGAASVYIEGIFNFNTWINARDPAAYGSLRRLEKTV